MQDHPATAQLENWSLVQLKTVIPVLSRQPVKHPLGGEIRELIRIPIPQVSTNI
jgi:hypothetical protein